MLDDHSWDLAADRTRVKVVIGPELVASDD